MTIRTRLLAVTAGSAIASFLVIAVANAQSQYQGGGQQRSMEMRAGEQMGGGMEMGGMGGMGKMGGGGGMGGMGGMGCMQMMHKEVMQMMQHDPKLRGRMMELHGEMMRTMGEAMIEHGKELQQGK